MGVSIDRSQVLTCPSYCRLGRLGRTWIIVHAVQGWEHRGTDLLVAGNHFAEVVCCERHEYLVARVASQPNIAHQKNHNLCLAETPACWGARPGLRALLCSCRTAAASLRISHLSSTSQRLGPLISDADALASSEPSQPDNVCC